MLTRTLSCSLAAALVASCAAVKSAPRANGVLAVMKADGRFTTFVRLLEQTEIAERLDDDGPFTIFAFTDEAYADNGGEALHPDVPEKLEGELLYHIALGRYAIADFKGKKSIDTVTSFPVPVLARDAQKVLVASVDVGAPALDADNGIIYPMGKVLKPPKHYFRSLIRKRDRKNRRVQPDQWWW